jgi:iron complex outermembrane receptor protein
MMSQLQKYSRTLLFTSLTSLVASPVMAQKMLEEVVVVAQKRETNLMDTAAAVSAFNADTRDDLGIDNLQDLALHTPSLTVAPSRISIRGVGRSNIALGSDPGVGIYWDGVYTTENDIFSFSNFLDIDRVEVLRGPQGTLYGRNSIGGAVNFISVQPDSEKWGGKVIVEAGNYDYLVVQGLASGPITEKLSVLVALSTIEREGLQKNEGSNKRFDELDSDYGTISLKHETTDSWTNTLKVSNRKSNPRSAQPYTLDAYSTDYIQFIPDTSGAILNLPGMFPGQNFANGNQGMTRQNPALQDESTVSVDVNPFVDQERTSTTFISEMDFDSYTLKYTGGYSDFEYKSDFDADGIKASESGLDWSQIFVAPGTPVSLLNGGFTLTPGMTTRPFSQNNKAYSHELQIITDLDGDLNFIAGLYYYQSDETQALSFIESNDELMATYRALSATFLGNAPVSDENFLFEGAAELETTSYAAYGQMDWDWTDQTVLTVGLRYSYDEKEGSDQTFVQYVGDPGQRTAKDDWDQVTWRVGLDHALSDDHFVYGFVATGYRSGGFNLMAPTDNLDVNSVDPEEVLSFELGYKGSFADNRMNVASAFYYYDYTDIQVLRTDIVNGVSVPVFENASDATAWGLEVEVLALLTDNLTFSTTYSYNNSEYEDYESADSNACAVGPLSEGNSLSPLCTQTQDLSGNEFLLTPEHKAAASLLYFWQMASLDWQGVVSYQYIGEQFTSAFNNDSYDKLDAWGRWDARLSMSSQEETWEVTAYVKNISDDREAVFNDRPSSVSHLSGVTLTDPRTYGVRLTYNF